jgi:4-carboxymuconolactone decarboxylase
MIGRPLLDPRTGCPGTVGRERRVIAANSAVVSLRFGKRSDTVSALESEALSEERTAMTDDSVHQARIEPLQPPYDDQLAAALAKWMPPGSSQEPLALFRTLFVNDELAGRMRPLGAGILGPSAKVPPPLREIMIHRTCALTGAEYEWGVHAVAFGRPLGLSDEQLCSTVDGSHEDECWSAEQASVFALADELHRTSTVSEQLWQRLADAFDEPQLIELLITAGWYHVIGYLCNGLRVAREPWAERFPR